jgi:hypothetical protein
MIRAIALIMCLSDHNCLIPTLAVLLLWSDYWTSLVLLTSFLCTYPFTYMLSWLKSMNFLRALFRVDFVIALAGLSLLLIYRISVISFCLYDWQSVIISIIRRFFSVILSLTKHLYNEYKSVQTTIGVCENPSCLLIILIIVLITIVISTPFAIS